MIERDENLFEPTAQAARQIKLNSFVLTNEELEKLRLLGDSDSVWGKTGFKSITLPMLFDKKHEASRLEWALEKLCRQVGAAVEDGCDIFILSDSEMNETGFRFPRCWLSRRFIII